MIGNAVPPVLTYYLFQSMLEIPVEYSTPIKDSTKYYHQSPDIVNPYTPPDVVKNRYRESRTFRLAIPGYRFGSGVRFELSNGISDRKCIWSIRFFYGSSKSIREVTFNKKKYDRIIRLLENQGLDISLIEDDIVRCSKALSSSKLQKRWTHKSKEYTHPFEVIDNLSNLGLKISDALRALSIDDETFSSIVGENLNLKLFDNKELVLSGLVLGYHFNKNIRS